MLYTRKTFSCPTAGTKVSEKNWDRAFLAKDQFEAKYGPGSHDEAQAQ